MRKRENESRWKGNIPAGSYRWGMLCFGRLSFPFFYYFPHYFHHLNFSDSQFPIYFHWLHWLLALYGYEQIAMTDSPLTCVMAEMLVAVWHEMMCKKGYLKFTDTLQCACGNSCLVHVTMTASSSICGKFIMPAFIWDATQCTFKLECHQTK